MNCFVPLVPMNNYTPALVFYGICIIAILRHLYSREQLREKQKIASAKQQHEKVRKDLRKEQQIQVDEYLQQSVVDQELSTFAVMARKKRSEQLEWFITDWGTKSIPSPAEQLIIDELNKYSVKWKREVSFKGLQLVSTGYARFDFYLIDHNVCIEYNGKIWHVAPDRVENDKIKARFCKKHQIELVILDSSHYYHIEHIIRKLMKRIAVVAR